MKKKIIFMIITMLVLLLSVVLAEIPKVNYQNVSNPRTLEKLLREKFDAIDDDIANLPAGNLGTGNVYYVDSAVGSDTYTGKKKEHAKATIDAAINLCTADNGDIIYVMQGHTETITTDGGIDQDVAGVIIKGLGIGESRPKVTFATSNDADWHLDANSCAVSNINFVGAKNGQTALMTISGDDCVVYGCDFRTPDVNTTYVIQVGVATGDSDRVIVQNCTFYQGGTSNGDGIAVTKGATGQKIIGNTMYGYYSIAPINVADVACIDLTITDNTLTNTKSAVYGIRILGSTPRVIVGDNTVSVDTAGNAISFQDIATMGLTALSSASVGGTGLADGTDVYPASVVNDSLWAKVLSKSELPSASSYNNTTDSLEAISDKIVASSGTNIDANLAALLEFRDTADANLQILIDANTSAQADLDAILADTTVINDINTNMQVDLDAILADTTVINDINTNMQADLDAILADTGTDGVKIADGEIDAGAVADDAIDAGAIATDAIGSAEFAAAAVTKIWNNNISAYSGAGYAGTYVKTLYDDWLNGGRLDLLIDGIKAQTDIITDVNTNAQADLDAILADTTVINDINTNAQADLDAILADTTIIADINTNAQADLDAILASTGTALETLVTDVNTNAQADLDAILLSTGAGLATLVADVNTNAQADLDAILADTTVINDVNINAQADLDAILASTGTALETLVTDVNTNAQADLDAILADTTVINDINTNAQADLDAILADTTIIADINTNAQADLDAILASTGTALETLVTDVNTNAQADLDAILADTTIIADVNTNAQADLDAILTDTGITIPGTITVIDTNVAKLEKAAAPSKDHPNYFVVDTGEFDTTGTWSTVTAHEIAVVTGCVYMTVIAECNSTVASVSDNGTITLGDETTTDSVIASSTLGAGVMAAGELWVDATLTRTILTQTQINTVTFAVCAGKDIGYTIGTNALSGGSMKFHVWWTPLNSTGAVTAGEGGAF